MLQFPHYKFCFSFVLVENPFLVLPLFRCSCLCIQALLKKSLCTTITFAKPIIAISWVDITSPLRVFIVECFLPFRLPKLWRFLFLYFRILYCTQTRIMVLINPQISRIERSKGCVHVQRVLLHSFSQF